MRGKTGRAKSWFGFGEKHERGWGGPWGGGRQRFFESGEVRIALLSLLEDGPKHGYDLMKEMEARSGGMYKASAGSVYPNLQMMADEGLITATEAGDGKRVFTLTSSGRAEIEKNRETIDRIWNRADDWGDWRDAISPGAMEIWGPARRLAGAAFKAAAHGDEATVDRVRKVLQNAADEIESMEKVQ